MSGVGGHKVSVEFTTECILRIGPYRSRHYIPTKIHQAKCECKWQGPRRLHAWEAEDDANNHQSNPQEGQ